METNNKNVVARKNVGASKIVWASYASPMLYILIRDVFLIYSISFFIIMILTISFSYINSEVIVDNFMLNFRSYLLGSIHTGEEILSARFESIGIFAIHFTLFFAYLFLYLFSNRIDAQNYSGEKECSGEQNRMGELCEPLLYLITSLAITFFLRDRFLFCLPEALCFASLIILCKMTIFKNTIIKGSHIILFNRILLIPISIYGIVSIIIRYM